MRVSPIDTVGVKLIISDSDGPMPLRQGNVCREEPGMTDFAEREKRDPLPGIGALLKDTARLIKGNPVVVAPPVAVSVIMGFFSLSMSGRMAAMSGNGMEGQGGGLDFVLARSAVTLLGWVLYSFAQGMVASMVSEARDRGVTSLGHGFNEANGRIGSLMTAGFAVGLILILGFMLLFLPGVIFSYIFIFVSVVIMLEGKGALDAMKRSVQIVKDNISYTILVFGTVIGMGLLSIILNLVLVPVPLLGPLMGMFLTGAYVGVSSVFVVRAYQEITAAG